MKVELIEIGRVIPYARNPRHNENAIAKVAASIKEYGFRQPIVVDEGMGMIFCMGDLVPIYSMVVRVMTNFSSALLVMLLFMKALERQTSSISPMKSCRI